jgi:hypothetical protein
MRHRKRVFTWASIVGAGVAITLPAAAGAEFKDLDARSGSIAPTAAQKSAKKALGAKVRWNRFGTPRSVIDYSGFLGPRVRASTAKLAARRWLVANGSLFRLSNTQGLRTTHDARFPDSRARSVVFRQTFGGLPAALDGVVTVGLTGSAASGWRVAYASSSLTPDRALSGAANLSAAEAWARAAADVGRATSLAQLGTRKRAAGWTVFTAPGFSQVQRARQVAVPTPANGVRRAWETLLTDVRGGQATSYTHHIDAETGAVLARQDNVMQSHPAAEQLEGTLGPADGACATEGPWTVSATEEVGAINVTASADNPLNDIVITLLRDGTAVASQDTGTSPEALAYDPPDEGRGTYTVELCDFADGTGWIEPRDYSGAIAFSPVGGGGGGPFPYPPAWRVFPNTPRLGGQTHPWNYPSLDNRQLWCWETTAGCDREVRNQASRAPWDVDARTGVPSFTTHGNNASSAEAWGSPLTPGGAQRPSDPQRRYDFPWENKWFTSECSQSNFVPGGNDIEAAVTNLFVMHNRMHDWSYNLGFDERRWNAQAYNFGTGNTLENDPLLGDAQAGAANGGFPSYTGRDNANMITNPDGVSSITNMYLWQPIAGAFYAPCVDGDYDMAVIGHEFGHMIENRMIGKGNRRAGHHAGAMGESNGDLNAVEYLNEYGFTPVSGENPFAVGAYVTGNKDRAIRNYGMNFPRVGAFPQPGVSLVRRGGPLVDPLNFSNMGYDITGPQVHADGEIWSATNYDIRQALVNKYNAAFPAGDRNLQRQCADGVLPPERCPGNRRWAQIMYDAYVLMPVGPSMLDARDAYLAADRMRFNGANQDELWLAFARRGFGLRAQSTNSANDTDADPMPDFQSPRHGFADVQLRAFDREQGGIGLNKLVRARFYVGHYEARTSPIADTTHPPQPTENLDGRARFAPGTYEFVVQARGYGSERVRRTFQAGTELFLRVELEPNRASSAKGATATGDGADHGALIDDTEATAWDLTGATPSVRNKQVTVDLQGGLQTIRRAQVSALLEVGQNRFTALRSFALEVSRNGTTFTRHFTSTPNAFPGFNPRPVAPEMIMREFTFPAVSASHVRLVVLNNQCTGNPAFQGDQDADPTSGSDCRLGSPGSGPVELPGDLPQVVAPRDNEVHIAELQLFSR